MKINLSKIIAYYNNLNDEARYCLLVGVVFLIVLVDLLLLVLPQVGSITSVNDQIRQLTKDTQQVLTDKGRINVLRKNLQAQRDQYMSLSSKVSPPQEVPAVLSNISSIANEYGVKIDQLVPEKKQQEFITKTADGSYYGLPVLIKARSSYHKFGYFLNKLENEDLFFSLKDFIIQNDDKDPNTHLYSLTINIILVDRT